MTSTPNHRRRTLFALLVPVAAFAGVTGASASGCIGGTDTIDDQSATIDSTVEETAVDGADAAKPDSATPETTTPDTATPDADVLVDTSSDAREIGPDVILDVIPDVIPDVGPADVPDVVDVADVVDATDTRLDVLDVSDAEVLEADVSDAAGVPSLGAAAKFSVLGGSTVTSTGLTVVTGDLGVWSGLAVTGFPPGVVIAGSIDHGTAVSAAGQASLTVLYDALKGAACGTNMSSMDLSGKTLGPGVYCFTSSAAIGTVGTLTLDAKGDPNAFWIFQIGSTFTTSDTSAVTVINGGSACNVFWQVGSSATIGKGNIFGGNIVAFDSITVQTGSSVSGRVLARNAAVTLDDNAIGFATCTGGSGTDAGLDASDSADVGDGSDAGDAADVSDGLEVGDAGDGG